MFLPFTQEHKQKSTTTKFSVSTNLIETTVLPTLQFLTFVCLIKKYIESKYLKKLIF